MANTTTEAPSVDTGGAAYIGGNVDTGGGDFVGRDQVKILYPPEGATVADLTRLLTEVRTLLPQAGLDQDTVQAIEGDFRIVEEQAVKPEPKGALIKNKLKGAADLIQETGKTADGVEKVLTLVGRAVAVAAALF